MCRVRVCALRDAPSVFDDSCISWTGDTKFAVVIERGEVGDTTHEERETNYKKKGVKFSCSSDFARWWGFKPRE